MGGNNMNVVILGNILDWKMSIVVILYICYSLIMTFMSLYKLISAILIQNMQANNQ